MQFISLGPRPLKGIVAVPLSEIAPNNDKSSIVSRIFLRSECKYVQTVNLRCSTFLRVPGLFFFFPSSPSLTFPSGQLRYPHLISRNVEKPRTTASLPSDPSPIVPSQLLICTIHPTFPTWSLSGNDNNFMRPVPNTRCPVALEMTLLLEGVSVRL